MSDLSCLTPRQRQIMGLIAAGLGNKQIAHRLNISVHTVRNHRQGLMNKLNIHGQGTAALTRLAITWGVLEVRAEFAEKDQTLASLGTPPSCF